MMNPVPWLQMTNMISYQGLVRTFLSDKNKKASYKIINYGDYYDADYYDNNLKNEVFDWIGKWS